MTFHLPVLTFLYADPHYVPYCLHMPLHDPVISCKSRGSYGAHVLDHLAADGAGFAGGQVAVVAVLEVDADFRGGFHLELVHCVAGFRDVDVGRITVRHVVASPCLFSGNHLSISFTRSFSASAPIMNANSRREFHGNF